MKEHRYRAWVQSKVTKEITWIDMKEENIVVFRRRLMENRLLVLDAIYVD